MNNKQYTNTCYVFSQATLDLALKEWIEKNIKNKPKKQETYQIVAAALPWFLKHLNQSDAIYMFTHIDLIAEIDIWKSSQLTEYPHQKKRIENICTQIISFFQSDIVSQHKMTIHA